MNMINKNNEKIGLVLEGGGLRGVYTSGVLDAFLDNDIKFPYVIGVSAGVCNAISYFSKQRGRNIKVNVEHCDDKEYFSIKNILKKGAMFNENMLFDKIPHNLYPFDYDTYTKEYTTLKAVVTDCETGKPIYYELNDLKNQYDIVKASSWLPFISKMVHYDGKKLLDGGVSDSIPIKKALEDGCKKCVVVLTRPKEYRKTANKSGLVANIVYRNYPNFAKAISTRYKKYNDTLDYIEKLEKQGKIVVIRPSETLDVARLEKDPQKLIKAYRLGYDDAVDQMIENFNKLDLEFKGENVISKNDMFL